MFRKLKIRIAKMELEGLMSQLQDKLVAQEIHTIVDNYGQHDVKKELEVLNKDISTLRVKILDLNSKIDELENK